MCNLWRVRQTIFEVRPSFPLSYLCQHSYLLQKDGSVKYVGGETYLEKVPSSMRYADLMHRMSEKVNGAVTLKYSPPGEEVDVNNLVTCVDDDHVQVSLSYFPTL